MALARWHDRHGGDLAAEWAAGLTIRKPRRGAEQLGDRLADITQRCTDPDLLKDAAAVLAGLTSIRKEVQGHDGRWFVRQALPYRTHDNRIEGVVITFSDVAAEALREARLYAEAIVDTVRERAEVVFDPSYDVNARRLLRLAG